MADGAVHDLDWEKRIWGHPHTAYDPRRHACSVDPIYFQLFFGALDVEDIGIGRFCQVTVRQPGYPPTTYELEDLAEIETTEGA